ncbi:MAG: hypothetical protein ACLFPS_04370 [Clostridia bacterium]
MNLITSIIVGVLAGVSSYYISQRLKKGPVYGSVVVTFIAGLLFTVLESIGINGALDLAVVAATASYAGMVGNMYVKNLLEMSVVSIITSILYMSSTNLFVGIGGRLGVIAAVSCFAFIGLKRIYKYKYIQSVKNQLKKSEDCLY